MSRLVAVLLCVAACTADHDELSFDLAGHASDLSGAPAACTMVTGGHRAQFVVAGLVLPHIGDFGYDLDGDGLVENRYAQFLTRNADADMSTLQASVTFGQNLLLLEVDSADATFANDPCARTTLSAALPQTKPSLDGTGTFVVDSTLPSVSFEGPIEAGRMSSNAPASTGVSPVTAAVELWFGQLLRTPLVGAHLSWFHSGDMLTAGMLQGAIRKSDLDATVLPAVAASMAAGILAHDPQVATFFAPDVQLFAADGVTWGPVPRASAIPDSWSVGIAFVAVPATF